LKRKLIFDSQNGLVALFLQCFVIRFNKTQHISESNKKIMAGFFGSVFGPKTKYVDENANSPSNDDQNGNGYFLNPDEAQSMGNIDYMRKANKIRRTFPKTATFAGGELIREVSATEQKKLSLKDVFSDNSTPQKPIISNNGSNGSSQPAAERRRTDPNMEMFRNMAKGMKKP
jgi:hypothetical protein